MRSRRAILTQIFVVTLATLATIAIWKRKRPAPYVAPHTSELRGSHDLAFTDEDADERRSPNSVTCIDSHTGFRIPSDVILLYPLEPENSESSGSRILIVAAGYAPVAWWHPDPNGEITSAEVRLRRLANVHVDFWATTNESSSTQNVSIFPEGHSVIEMVEDHDKLSWVGTDLVRAILPGKARVPSIGTRNDLPKGCGYYCEVWAELETSDSISAQMPQGDVRINSNVPVISRKQLMSASKGDLILGIRSGSISCPGEGLFLHTTPEYGVSGVVDSEYCSKPQIISTYRVDMRNPVSSRVESTGYSSHLGLFIHEVREPGTYRAKSVFGANSSSRVVSMTGDATSSGAGLLCLGSLASNGDESLELSSMLVSGDSNELSEDHLEVALSLGVEPGDLSVEWEILDLDAFSTGRASTWHLLAAPLGSTTAISGLGPSTHRLIASDSGAGWNRLEREFILVRPDMCMAIPGGGSTADLRFRLHLKVRPKISASGILPDVGKRMSATFWPHDEDVAYLQGGIAKLDFRHTGNGQLEPIGRAGILPGRYTIHFAESATQSGGMVALAENVWVTGDQDQLSVNFVKGMKVRLRQDHTAGAMHGFVLPTNSFESMRAGTVLLEKESWQVLHPDLLVTHPQTKATLYSKEQITDLLEVVQPD